MSSRVLVLNGPNLNLLGTREPAVYGSRSLADIEAELAEVARRSGAEVVFFQSNHEGALVDRIHSAKLDGTDFLIVNAGAFTHTSVALRDALAAVELPFIEVHLSNVHRREQFRHHSYLADLALGTIVGLGAAGYRYALEYALGHTAKNSKDH
ncbi:MAG: type II 3-dehydroquinate dehydratase [Burkholderiaceae bacterium]|nr:type II 3-dehydroquinate dehydratase [Burkholderiaceae bacterium]MDH5207263.1 type II 3-dehydroquinate dehydratase [Burkholderiaceae bacterium]